MRRGQCMCPSLPFFVLFFIGGVFINVLFCFVRDQFVKHAKFDGNAFKSKNDCVYDNYYSDEEDRKSVV